jgi:hypothetical protein
MFLIGDLGAMGEPDYRLQRCCQVIRVQVGCLSVECSNVGHRAVQCQVSSIPMLSIGVDSVPLSTVERTGKVMEW